VLVFADRSGLDHPDAVSDIARVLLVMGLEFRQTPEHLVINGMHDLTLDRHNDGLGHLVANDAPHPFSPLDSSFRHALQPFRR
jgi:hypothetical protein